jgi:hypothetical protein
VSNIKETILSTMNSTGASSFSFSASTILNVASSNEQCSQSNAKLFVQYQCLQSAEQLETKRGQAITVSCLAVFAVGVYLTVLFYFKRASDLNQIQWDMETITPGDYTVQLEISEKAFNHFKTTIYPQELGRKSDLSIGESLKAYIKKEL